MKWKHNCNGSFQHLSTLRSTARVHVNARRVPGRPIPVEAADRAVANLQAWRTSPIDLSVPNALSS